MNFKVVLVDVNPKMVKAWRDVFEGETDVTVVHGSMLDQKVDLWITPTNSHAKMDGGLDGAIRQYFGAKIQLRVQAEIAKRYGGVLPVGYATCVETGVAMPRYLVSTPTMHSVNEDISDTLNVALATAAALYSADETARRAPGTVGSVALPGLGANTGRVPAEICADLMWTAYDILKNHPLRSFAETRAALEAALGALGNPTPATKPIANTAAVVPLYPAAVKGPVVPKAPAPLSTKPAPGKGHQVLDDFDDHE